MEAELLEMFSAYLGNDYPEEDEPVLLLLIQKAISDFKIQINYPKTFSEEKINEDLEKNKFCIFELAYYDYNMQGTEFQTSHSENGVSRSWNNKAEIYAHYSITPYIDM